jgi:PKD repeat protein
MKMLKLATNLLAILIILEFTACKKDKHPKAQFTASATSIGMGSAITFTNTSTDASDYLWKFGDGNGSVEKNPTYNYDSIGRFKVTLTALGTGGEDTVSTMITVKSNNITINDGVGIKEAVIGATWGTIKNKLGTDTTYATELYTATIHEDMVFYNKLGIAFVFLSYSPSVLLTDQTSVISVAYPYAGTSQKGIRIGSPKGNVMYYYGTPARTYTYTDYVFYGYANAGISFYVDISNKVFWMDVYTPSNNLKAAKILPIKIWPKKIRPTD